MKIVIYTCNFGNYDTYKSPKIVDQKSKYIYFTDNSTKIDNYKRIKCNTKKYHDTISKASRYPKICSHKVLPDHDYSIYVDASFNLYIEDAEKLIESLDYPLIAQFYHGSDESRNHSISEEAIICMTKGLDDRDVIRQQMVRYKEENFPDDLGLYSGGFIIRKNDTLVNRFNEIWWSEVDNGSKRDQLSEMYALWKTNLKMTTMDNSIYNNKYLRKEKHIKDR